MNVAVLTSLFPSAPRPHEGIFAWRRWSGMARRGHAVRVVHPQPLAPPSWTPGLPSAWAEIAAMPAREERGGLPVERPRYLHWPGRPLANARRFARCGLRRTFAAGAPDVVVCDYAWPAAAVAPELSRRGVPCVVSGRGSDVLEVAGEAGLAAPLASFLRDAGHWCGVSQDLVDAMDRLAQEQRGVLVPNGVDLELFHPRDRAQERARVGFDAERPLVLVVGHLIPRKDPMASLAAFHAALHAGAPSAHLAFIGSGPLEGDLRRATESLGLEREVRFLGQKTPEEIASWMGAANVLLLTSHREGRPNVVLEALACGLPVLATEAGGTGEVLDSERMLSTSREPGRLGRALASLIADPPSAAELAERVAHLSWDKSLEALEALLEAARRPRRAPALEAGR